MRILVVSNFYPPEFLGGYELGCAQMTDALVARGHDVHVLTSTSTHAAANGDPRIMRRLEVPPIYSRAQMEAVGHEVLTYLHARARLVNEGNVSALADAIAQVQPDVVYLWNIYGLGGFGLLALLAHQGVPWLWHLQDRIPHELCYFAGHRPELAAVFGTLFRGAYVGCSSHVIGETMAFGFDLGDHVQVIPNWVVGPPQAPRRELYRGGVLKIMSASGTLTEDKGTHVLIEAAARLRAQGVANFTIDMYGREDDPRWRRMILEHGLGDQVRLQGPRPHAAMLDLYREHDLFAFPTWTREPFGFVGLEAAAAGCLPLITADCGLAEWLIDGVDCLCARRDPGDFARRIAEVISGEVDLPGIVTRAQATVHRYFHVDRAARAVEAALEEARGLGGTPRGPLDEFFTLARFSEGLAQTLVLEAR